MSDDDEPRGTVIHLFGPPPAVEGAPTVGWAGVFCYPHAPIVDRFSRTVTCNRCKAKLDPVDVLLEVAHRHEQWTALTKEVSAMRAEVEALKAEEQRVKARTQSHARKDAAEAVAAERATQERRRLEVITRSADIRRALTRIEQLMGKPTPRQLRRQKSRPQP